MKSLILAALTTLSLSLVGCTEEETQQYLYNHGSDTSSVAELCTQENIDRYGSDVCIPQQLNDDGTVKARD